MGEKLEQLVDAIDNLSDPNKKALKFVRALVKARQTQINRRTEPGWKPTVYVSLEEYNWMKTNRPELFDKFNICISYSFEDLERMEMWERIARESERRIRERSKS